jgi:hypothetical protein
VAFWYITPCSFVVIHRRFGRTCCLRPQRQLQNSVSAIDVSWNDLIQSPYSKRGGKLTSIFTLARRLFSNDRQYFRGSKILAICSDGIYFMNRISKYIKMLVWQVISDVLRVFKTQIKPNLELTPFGSYRFAGTYSKYVF